MNVKDKEQCQKPEGSVHFIHNKTCTCMFFLLFFLCFNREISASYESRQFFFSMPHTYSQTDELRFKLILFLILYQIQRKLPTFKLKFMLFFFPAG